MPVRSLTATALLVVLSACVLGRVYPLAQSSQSRMSSSGPRPSWASPAETDDGRTLMVVGSARSGAETQARQAASLAAIDRAVTRVVTELYADPGTITHYGVDALRQYVQKVSRVTDTWVGDANGAYEAIARVQVSKPFLQAVTVRSYATMPPAPPETALGFLVIPVRTSATALTRRTQVRMAKLRDGHFFFYFTIVQQENTVSLRLDRIQVLDDGSSGKTKWTFEISVAGRPAQRIPTAQYTDDVTNYLRDERPYVHTLKGGETFVEVKITGHRGDTPSKK